MNTKIKFGDISGKINYIPLSIYEDLISTYVNKVSKVAGVKSIIQIGSFTAPGLSDIDLIVVVNDQTPPKWEDISIKNIIKEKKGSEVIAHEVFVYPESLAQYIEGLFYLDRKKILFGKDIGNVFSKKEIEKLKLILSFEYSVHRMETLFSMLSLPNIQTRNILLFYSTLRHTIKLLNDFNFISTAEKEKKIKQIEDLRQKSINCKSENELIEKLNNWIVPSYKILFDAIILFGKKINNKDSINFPKKWILNHKKLIYNHLNNNDSLILFNKFYKYNKAFKGKILFEIMPYFVYFHVKLYNNMSLNNIKLDNTNNFNTLNTFQKRYVLANKHAEFIRKNNYQIPASYIVIENKPVTITKKVKKTILNILSLFIR